jgi:hypothetical protein
MPKFYIIGTRNPSTFESSTAKYREPSIKSGRSQTSYLTSRRYPPLKPSEQWATWKAPSCQHPSPASTSKAPTCSPMTALSDVSSPSMLFVNPPDNPRHLDQRALSLPLFLPQLCRVVAPQCFRFGPLPGAGAGFAAPPPAPFKLEGTRSPVGVRSSNCPTN